MAKTLRTYHDAGFETLGDLDSLIRHDSTRSIGAVWDRGKLNGDFDSAARLLSSEFCTSPGFGRAVNLPIDIVTAFSKDVHNSLKATEQAALAAITSDMAAFTQRGFTDVTLVVHPKGNKEGSSMFHTDSRNKFLCGYTAPVTEGLVDNDLGALVYAIHTAARYVKAKSKSRIRLDILGAKDRFQFPLHAIWKQSGRNDPSRYKPLYHKGHDATGENGARLLLNVADPS